MVLSNSVELILPNEQQEVALHIVKNLVVLRSSLASVKSAVVLCDHAETLAPTMPTFRSRRVVDHWRTIAGREVALHIFSFHDIIDAIDALLGMCPVIESLLDRSAFAAAKMVLKINFPKLEPLRAGPQSAEQVGDDSYTGNDHLVDPKKVRVSEDLLKNSYSAALGNQMVFFEVSHDMATKMQAIVVDACRAFDPIFGDSLSSVTLKALEGT